MYMPPINFKSPQQIENENEIYKKGYDDCFYKFEKIVKKLGKKYYKEFIKDVKDKNSELYKTYSSTTTIKGDVEKLLTAEYKDDKIIITINKEIIK